MKEKLTTTMLIAVLMAFVSGGAFAQEEITHTLVPSELQPAQDGYFLAGREVEINGEMVLKKGCDDNFGDNDHHESGTQQGFTYGNAMIMPTCMAKGTSPENWPTGYIQLTKHTYPGTDSAKFGYIISPELTNLKSLEIKVGTDVSINPSRSIWMIVESSLDGGETWNGFYIEQELTNQGGDLLFFEADGESPNFNAIVGDSKTGPILLRIATWPAPGEDKGERLKIFGVEIVAEEGGITPVNDEIYTQKFFEVSNKTITANLGNITVYKITGARIGFGRKVTIPSSGLYIVKSEEKGIARKVFIR